MARKALLLGIDDYDEASLRLPAAARDVADLTKALILAGFEPHAVTGLVSSRDDALSKAILRKRIRGVLNNARRGDEVLIYLSVHGIDRAGRRLLLPHDFDPQDPVDPGQLISDLAPFELASCCVASHQDPVDFREPLDLLQSMGIDAAECIRFVEFCAAEGAGSNG